MTNLGTADAVVGLEEEFDVEGGVVLPRVGCLGRRSRELTRLPRPVLAGDAFGRYPGHGGDFFRVASCQIVVRENASVPETLCERRADTSDLLEVIASLACVAGLGVITLRHLVLLICQPARPIPGVMVSASLGRASGREPGGLVRRRQKTSGR